MEYEIYKTDELTHWGVPGMKWGVRRYQRKDGSLTPAGERHRAKLEAQLKNREKVVKNKERTKAKFDKLAAKKRELEEREDALDNKKATTKPSKHAAKSDQPAQRTVKDMTDDELRERTTRMMLESNYLNAQRNLAASSPQQVSKGKQFMDKFVSDVIVPAATNTGRAWLEKTLRDKLGLNSQDPLSALEKQVRKARLEKELSNLKKKDDNISWENELKRQQHAKQESEKELRDVQYQIALLDAKAALKKRQNAQNGDD